MMGKLVAHVICIWSAVCWCPTICPVGGVQSTWPCWLSSEWQQFLEWVGSSWYCLNQLQERVLIATAKYVGLLEQ